MKNELLQDITSESITFGNVIFYNNNTIFLLTFIVIPFFLLGIILLTSISHILDTETDFQQRKLLKQGKPTTDVDLTYIRLPNASGEYTFLFVYDRLDPSGIKMHNLFNGSGYDRGSFHGIQGFSNIGQGQLNQNNELPMMASPINIFFMERSGAILSNGSAIGKEVTRVSRATRTNLLVKGS